jgi:hypothetical protein
MIVRYFRALLLSFYSASFYREVLRDWRGAGIGYLLVISFLLQFPVSAKYAWETYEWNLNERDAFLQQLPEMRFQGGELTTDVESPYEITGAGKGVTVILDPEDTIDVRELIASDALVFGRRELAVLDRRGRIRFIPYEKFGDFVVTSEKARQWVKLGSILTVPLLFLLTFCFFFLWRVLLSLVLAGVAHPFAKRISPPLRLADKMRLCAVALTPAVLVATAVDWAPAKVPYFWMIQVLMIGLYVTYALRSNRQPGSISLSPPPPGIG